MHHANVVPINRAQQAGFVYILASPAMPGIVKVGYTTGTPSARAAQLDTTGVPVAFEVVAAFESLDVIEAERRAHGALAARRIRPNREFFWATPADAIIKVEAALGLGAKAVVGRRRKAFDVVRRFVEAVGWVVLVMVIGATILVLMR